MKLFYAAEFRRPSQLGSRIWYNNLYLPLVDLGFEVVPFDYDLTPYYLASDPAFIAADRNRLQEELIAQIQRAHCQRPVDFFFSYFYSRMCDQETIRRIRQMGIRTINWFCNASYQFELIKDLAPAYDYCLVPEKFRLEDYSAIGANPVYFQQAANPYIYHPYGIPKEIDVSFAGQQYGDRDKWLVALGREGITVDVYGLNWDRGALRTCASTLSRRGAKEGLIDCYWRARAKRLLKIHGQVSDEEYVKLYSRSKISLGLSTCGDTHHDSTRILQIRLREFEGPMSGAFYLTEYVPGLEEFFEIGKEIACYHSEKELVEMTRHYLSHEEDRRRIAEAGYRRAVSEHTWQARFRSFFDGL